MPATPFSRIHTMPTVLKLSFDEGRNTRFVEGCVSSQRRDRQAEYVHQMALLRAYHRLGGGPYCRDHNTQTGGVIGRVVAFTMGPKGMETKAEVFRPGVSQACDELCELLEMQTPLSQSIGFNPYRDERGNYDAFQSGEKGDDGCWYWGGKDGAKDFDLLETSAVTIGANTDADLRMAKSLGLDYDRPWAETDSGVAHPTLLVPDLSTAPADPPPAPDPAPDPAPQTKASASLAANLAEEAEERHAYQIVDGLWSALVDTIEAILQAEGDRAPLVDQLAFDLGAELKRRLGTSAPVAAGPYAIASRAISELTRHKAGIQVKSVVPYQADISLADEDYGWDGAAAKRRIAEWAGGPDLANVDWGKYKRGFLWYDSAAADQVGSYKMPVCDVVDGDLVLVWKGIAGAAGALAGSRGGVAIPDADRPGIITNLEKYYKRFEKDFPEGLAEGKEASAIVWKCGEVLLAEECRCAEDLTAASGRIQAVRNIVAHWSKDERAPSPDLLAAVLSPMSMMAEITRAGRMLSQSNRQDIEACVAALQDLLARDEKSRAPNDEPDAESETEGKAATTEVAPHVLSPLGRALVAAHQPA